MADRMQADTQGRTSGPAQGDIDAEQHVGTLLRELKQDGLLLFRQQTALAKREMGRRRPMVQLAFGGALAASALGLVGLFVLAGAAIAAVALALPLWAALLVVGVGFALLSTGCLFVARGALKRVAAMNAKQGTPAVGRGAETGDRGTPEATTPRGAVS